MARSKGGLQKNVSSIFQDAAMPDDIKVTPDPVESEPDPVPVLETSPVEDAPKAEALPVQEPLRSTPDAPVVQAEKPDMPDVQIPPEPSQVPDRAEFTDPRIEAQMKKQKCEKQFLCYTSGLEDLCKARVIRRGQTVQCLEPKKKTCAYRLSSFFKKLCQCPVRIYIAKNHRK